MKTNRVAALFLALFALTLLAACGNKGDLVRPTETTEKPATPRGPAWQSDFPRCTGQAMTSC